MEKATAAKSASIRGESSPTSIWTRFEGRRKQAGKTRPRHFRWVADAALPLALAIAASIAVMLPGSLPPAARGALLAFLLAAILWMTTSIGADYIALAAVMALIVTGSSPQEWLFEALSADVIWLTIGAFIIGAAVEKTGLAGRVTHFVAERARTVSSTFWLLTTVLIPLSFLIPSTSGRAAVALPVFRSIAEAAGDRRIVRALALLVPTAILVSTVGALVGADSHLIANDLLYAIAKQRISFAQWALYGLPFAIAASYASCWAILHLFLDKNRRDRELRLPSRQPQPLSGAERRTLIAVGLTVALWLTESWHGFEIATVTVLSALALTLPGCGVLSWKEGLKAVSWNLIIFLGAALVLGRALIESGGSQWIIERMFALSGVFGAESRLLLLLVLAFISLTSHLYITSNAARAAALVPALLYLAGNLQLNPVAVFFISTVGMDYCLTFPVSSKALLIFHQLEGETFKPADLLRLSSVLVLVHLGLIVVFYYTYWRWIGLQL